MGDQNAQVGDNNEGAEKIMNKHGIGVRNDNGNRLVEFCLGNNLEIGGTLFPYKKHHKVTWISPNHKTRNQIDHILISS